MRGRLISAMAILGAMIATLPLFAQGGAVITPVPPPAPPAFGSAQGGELVLYDGELAASPLGLTIASWGAGTCSEVADYHYGKSPKSLKVTTKGLYQGARIDIKQGPALSPGIEGAYLVLQVVMGEAEKAPAGGGGQQAVMGLPAGFETAPGAAMPAAGGAGGMQQPGAGAMGPGGFGGVGEAGTDKKDKEKEKHLENLRLMAFYDKGLVVAERYPIIVYGTDADGWDTLAIPFNAFKGKSPVEGNLRRLVVCGDADESLYIGKISVKRDMSPMEAKILRPSTKEEADTEILAGQEVDLDIDAEVGLAAIDVTWDFDASDGIGEDAKGESTTHLYPKAGSFTVTAVVKDLANQKSPVVATYIVNVK